MSRGHRARTIATATLAGVMLVAACSSPHASSVQSPTSAPPTTPTAAQLKALATQYLAIATVGNHGLDKDFDGLEGPDHNRLAAARADLRDAAAVERLFDRRLLGIAFPAAIEATARALVNVNEPRATLASEAAASSSLQQLRSYEQRLDAANATVEEQVEKIRTQLGLPPPDTS